MKLLQFILPCCTILRFIPVAFADDFAARVDLAPLRTVSVQHRQTLKTLDSYARQTLDEITGRSSVDGNDALFTLLDMTYRPETYAGRDLVKVRNVPLRKDLADAASLSPGERERFAREGTADLGLFRRPDVREALRRLQSDDVRKSDAIRQAVDAAGAMEALCGGGGQPFPPAAILPPAPGDGGAEWRRVDEAAGNVPEWAEMSRRAGGVAPPRLAGYDDATLQEAARAAQRMGQAWRAGDAEGVNRAATALASLLPRLNAAAYPSPIKRQVEVAYNRLLKMTIPAAAFYFAAFVCFLTSSYSGLPRLRTWGAGLMAVAFLVHTTGVAVRWWLVGDVFPPIKNEFESVMFSAWFGAALGLTLELWRGRASRREQNRVLHVEPAPKRRPGLAADVGDLLPPFPLEDREGEMRTAPGAGIFGAAASFVGWLSLVAIFAVPFVTGSQIGGEVGQVSGVLMSYWLYVHVTLVTASYALIGMGFLLGTWWLMAYYAGPAEGSPGSLVAASAGPRPILAASSFRATGSLPATASFLATLDACNLVVLQLAFWVLGAGIVCGAVWADQSWGRPWGWDPKETFALVTWIVYLIVVHVRVAVADKAWWTAVLAVGGFFVMLFNWVGVNFFLVGLHSYA